MNQETIEFTSIINSVIQGSIAIGTFLLSYIVYKGSKKLAMVEYKRSIQDSWINSNIAVLQSERLAKLASQIINPDKIEGADADEDFYTKRYLRFLYLNIIESTFIGKDGKLIDPDFNDEITNDLLKNILKDDHAMTQIENGGFSTPFVEFCRTLCPKKIPNIEPGKVDDPILN